MPPDSKTWKPPVLFHFSVEFQWGKDKASASFAEVDGLGQELVLETGSNKVDLASDVKVSDVILKRAIEPINEKITVWVRNTFLFKYGAKIKPCTLHISLLDEQDKIAARWTCEWAFPIKWTVNQLNASESKIAVETITLRCKSLRRNR
nr:MAG TPA: tail tube protein [Caudoviricetes sp.]